MSTGPAPASWPLTPHQTGIHLADSVAERPELHSVVVAHRLTGAWDAERLRDRFGTLVRTHPALSARIVEDPSGLRMARTDAAPDWRDEKVPDDATEADTTRMIREEGRRPLDLTRGPLIRAALLRRADDSADLVLTASHLAVDDRSMDELVAALLSDGGTPQTGDYPAWATAAAATAGDGARRAAHLRAELAALEAAGAPEWGCGDSDAADADGAQTEFTVPAAVWQRLTATARSLGVTRYSALTAAVGLVWAHNGQAPAALVGAFVSRRPVREQHTIGYFSSTVAVPVHHTDDHTVGDHLRAVHRRALGAYRTADLPLFDVLPAGDTGPAAAALNVAVAPYWQPQVLHAAGLTAVPHPSPDLGVAKFPMLLSLDLEATDEARGLIQYQHRWFSPDTAARFARQVVAVLEAFADHPDAPLGSVDTLAPDDRRAALETARGARLAPEAVSVPELFARRAAQTPDRIAVTDEKTALSYAELDARSDTVARRLLASGVASGDRVGVRMARSADLVVALLAVLKTGAAYVPLDPAYPEARLAFMTEDAGISVVLGDTAEPPPGERPYATWVCVHGTAPDEDVALPAVDPGAPAYVIYTSGSTGRPKGVLVAHRNVVALLTATRGPLDLGPADVWTLFHSFAFDFSVWEIWGCLLTGGRLVVVPYEVSRNPEEFHRLLEEEEVTVLSQTPTAFGLLLATDRMTRGGLTVRLLVFGGEPLDSAALLPWFDRYPTARVENMYGITETTVHCTSHTMTREDALAGSRAVGRPLPGWDLYVLDPAGRPVPPGVPGEIHVGGAGVALGYLGRPELTAERFTTGDPATGPGGRLYRSGDRGRYLPDGTLEHLGRLDAQVKIRGFRIELGEIRGVLLEDPAVHSAAVVVGGAGTAEARLDAYAVLAPGGTAEDVLRRAAARLPEHMVPATLTALPALPLTGNGKLDTAALPAPGTAGSTGGSPAGPETDAAPEEPDDGAVLDRITEVWQQVLGVPVGPGDNFFALGGTSLVALRLKTALRDAGLPDLRLREIVRHATPAAMAELVRSRTREGAV
ncbi:non-ribosomal peptide synthetase [Streptomyces sclerotialus]|uniref:non-ribosomal peptide synthetase n=1 Tax=Streptomyces sclerotialus TaxID=1957 RepID=UPI00068C110E